MSLVFNFLNTISDIHGVYNALTTEAVDSTYQTLLIFRSNGIDPTNVTGDSMTVEDFLEYCALCSDQKELEEAEGGVSIRMHGAK